MDLRTRDLNDKIPLAIDERCVFGNRYKIRFIFNQEIL